jgi:hypothetical protein
MSYNSTGLTLCPEAKALQVCTQMAVEVEAAVVAAEEEVG